MKQIYFFAGVLVFFLVNFTGIAQDKEVSYSEELEEKARHGDPKAQFNLGYCYYMGYGIDEDEEAAFQWFKKSANQGNAEAQNRLGVMYLSGNAVLKNPEKAVSWLKKAANQGHSIAQQNLGITYYRQEKYNEATKWLKKAAKAGKEESQSLLGWCYNNGRGVVKDHEQAVNWIRKAAEQGNASAQEDLGMAYYHGNGVPQNHVKAFEWTEKAANQENSTAQYNLGYLYYHGYGADKNNKKAAYWIKLAYYNGSENAKQFWKDNELWEYELHPKTPEYPEGNKCILVGIAGIKNEGYNDDHAEYYDDLKVTVEDTSGNKLYAFTDDNGFFYIPNVTCNPYTIRKITKLSLGTINQSMITLTQKDNTNRLINTERLIATITEEGSVRFSMDGTTITQDGNILFSTGATSSYDKNKIIDYFTANFHIADWADAIGAVNQVYLLDVLTVNYDSIKNDVTSFESFNSRTKIKDYELNTDNNGVVVYLRNLSHLHDKTINLSYKITDNNDQTVFSGKRKTLNVKKGETKIIDYPLKQKLEEGEEYSLHVYLNNKIMDTVPFEIEKKNTD